MKRKYLLMASLLVLVAGCEGFTPEAVDSGEVADAQGEIQSLYQRLGGYDGLAAINDALGARIFDDPQFEQILAGMAEGSGDRVRQLSILHFCEVTGGDCVYIGRDLKTLHTGMGITDENWQSFMGHFGDAMTELNVADAEQSEVIDIFSGFQDQIVDGKP